LYIHQCKLGGFNFNNDKFHFLFISALEECKERNKVINVSTMHNNITNIICHSFIPVGYITVNGLNIASNSIEGYEIAVNFLGPEYHHYLICFKLKFYIKNNNFNDIKELIYNVDPRINNYALYNIAKESQKDNIINIVLDKILYLNWLEKLIFVQYLGDNTPHKELFNYMKQIKI
jgi:hypothetical protein